MMIVVYFDHRRRMGRLRLEDSHVLAAGLYRYDFILRTVNDRQRTSGDQWVGGVSVQVLEELVIDRLVALRSGMKVVDEALVFPLRDVDFGRPSFDRIECRREEY